MNFCINPRERSDDRRNMGKEFEAWSLVVTPNNGDRGQIIKHMDYNLSVQFMHFYVKIEYVSSNFPYSFKNLNLSYEFTRLSHLQARNFCP